MINNNLEQQIKYLYNDYFCNCNEEIKITELIDVRDGTHDSPKSTEQGKHLITSKHLKKYGVDKSTANIISEFDYAKINERSIVCTNDILISMIGTVGIVSLIIENPVDFAVKNVGIFKTSNFIEYTYYIHCFLNSNNTQNYIKSHLAGTTQKYIRLGELRNLIINKPDESQLNKFNLIVHPLYQQIILNVKENVRLTQLRDTLLPKLMSGEIDVSEVDISTDKLYEPANESKLSAESYNSSGSFASASKNWPSEQSSSADKLLFSILVFEHFYIKIVILIGVTINTMTIFTSNIVKFKLKKSFTFDN